MAPPVLLRCQERFCRGADARCCSGASANTAPLLHLTGRTSKDGTDVLTDACSDGHQRELTPPLQEPAKKPRQTPCLMFDAEQKPLRDHVGRARRHRGSTQTEASLLGR